MAGTNLSFPYDSEIFNYEWKNTPDVYLTTMINSGAVVNDAEIARLISNGSNFFTTPYYDVLGGSTGDDLAKTVYNGVNDIPTADLTGGTYSGCVYGRQQGWNVKSFIKDFNSGADPMAQIVAGVSQFWIKERQKRFIKILQAVFGVTGDADWALHTTNIASTTSTVAESNKMGATTLNDACIKANGDNATEYTLAIMHSVVANRLANLQLLEYSKYTDSAGITRALPLATINGMTVIINDNVPVDAKISYALTSDVEINNAKTYYTRSGSSGAYVYKAVASPLVDDIATYYEKTDLADEYTTYILGNGCMRYAQAPVDNPSEMDRQPAKFGGQDFIYTRIRECLTPYGFNFKGDVTTDVGIPDSVLTASASYERKMPAKSIFMAQVITN